MLLWLELCVFTQNGLVAIHHTLYLNYNHGFPTAWVIDHVIWHSQFIYGWICWDEWLRFIKHLIDSNREDKHTWYIPFSLVATKYVPIEPIGKHKTVLYCILLYISMYGPIDAKGRYKCPTTTCSQQSSHDTRNWHLIVNNISKFKTFNWYNGKLSLKIICVMC